MNIRPQYTRLPIAALTEWRTEYLDQLSEPQDALLETLVQQAEGYLIEAKGATIGYAAVHEGCLVEMYLAPRFELYFHRVLPHLLRELRITSALVKTFDAILLSCALDFQSRLEMRGALSRHFLSRSLPEIARVRYTSRIAVAGDLPRVLAVDQEVFTHPERLAAVVDAEQLLVFEREDALVGFGILRPVIVGRPDVELGIAVDTPFRNKGYAIYMLRDMAEHCFSRGLRPITGCSRANEASIRMGLRVGFVSRYRLVELFFDDTSLAAGPDW